MHSNIFLQMFLQHLCSSASALCELFYKNIFLSSLKMYVVSFPLFDYLSRWIARMCFQRLPCAGKSWGIFVPVVVGLEFKKTKQKHIEYRSKEGCCFLSPPPLFFFVLFIFGWVNTVTDRFLDWNSARVQPLKGNTTSITEEKHERKKWEFGSRVWCCEFFVCERDDEKAWPCFFCFF